MRISIRSLTNRVTRSGTNANSAPTNSISPRGASIPMRMQRVAAPLDRVRSKSDPRDVVTFSVLILKELPRVGSPPCVGGPRDFRGHGNTVTIARRRHFFRCTKKSRSKDETRRETQSNY